MNKNVKINGGVYLVCDPAMDWKLLLEKLGEGLSGGLGLVQIWNHWNEGADKIDLLKKINILTRKWNVPLLIDNDWKLYREFPDLLDGVHLDSIPEGLPSGLTDNGLWGITCSNDLSVVRWADRHHMDYISFCSMLPSTSAGSCELVKPETINKARKLTNLPFFISGGIKPENLRHFKSILSFQGVAVISGILGDPDPRSKVLEYSKILNN